MPLTYIDVPVTDILVICRIDAHSICKWRTSGCCVGLGSGGFFVQKSAVQFNLNCYSTPSLQTR